MTEWDDIALGQLIDLFDHKRVPLSSQQRSERPGPYPYYGAQGIIDHIDDFIFDGRFILIPEDGENLRSRKLPIAYFADGQFWVNNHAHIAKAKPGIAVDRFVQGALEATDIGPFVTGAAQPKLSQANLRQIPLRVPPVEDQITIASILDSIDDLIENNRRRVEVLEEMARAIYREWFVRFRDPGHEVVPLVDSPLGPIPEGWSVRTIQECASALVDGDWVETKDQGGGAYRLLQVSNIGLGAFRETGKYRYMTQETFQRLNCTEVSIGDILISRMPEPVGRAWLVDHLDEPAVTVVDVALLTPTSKPMGVYLNQVLNSPEHLSRAETVATGTTRKRITRSVLGQSTVLVPDNEVLTRFSDHCVPAREMATSLRLSSRALERSRDLLLPKLVTGQVNVSHLDLDALTEAAIG